MSDAAALPRFRPLDVRACEGCATPLLPYDPAAGDVRVFALRGAALRCFCSPACAGPAGWPWLDGARREGARASHHKEKTP